MGRGRIFAIAVFASPMLFGCNAPSGCGPVSSSTAAGVYNVTVWPPSEITRRSGRQRQIKYHRFNGRPPPELSSSSAASSLPKMSGFAPSSGSRRWG